MRILVDTSIWSLSLRRRRRDLDADERQLVYELEGLIRDGRVLMVGPIRQEILTGIADPGVFDLMATRLSDFEEDGLEAEDYVEAARCANRCRARGVSGSPVDFLLCAAARRRSVPIFTSDTDFDRYAGIIEIELHRPETRPGSPR